MAGWSDGVTEGLRRRIGGEMVVSAGMRGAEVTAKSEETSEMS